MKSIVDYAVSSRLRILTSDKEGFVVVAPEATFQEKACAAVDKNFRVTDLKAPKVKETAIALFQKHSLDKLVSSVKKALHLDVFFATKTHKPEIPFRAIVTETRGMCTFQLPAKALAKVMRE